MKVKRKLSKAQSVRKPCVCGAPLPHHLADLADDHFTHVCSCERAYKVIAGVFVLNGTEANPFARHDRSEQLSAEQVDANLMLYAVIWANQTPRERVAVATKLRRSGDVIERAAGDFLRALEAKISQARGK